MLLETMLHESFSYFWCRKFLYMYQVVRDIYFSFHIYKILISFLQFETCTCHVSWSLTFHEKMELMQHKLEIHLNL